MSSFARTSFIRRPAAASSSYSWSCKFERAVAHQAVPARRQNFVRVRRKQPADDRGGSMTPPVPARSRIWLMTYASPFVRSFPWYLRSASPARSNIQSA